MVLGLQTDRLSSRVLALVAILLACLTTSTAEAQWNGNWQLINSPPVTERDTTILERMLSLSEQEVELIGVLREDASAEFSRISSVMQEIVNGAREEFQQNRDRSVWEDAGERLEVFVERRQEIRDDFLDNVELSLVDVDPVVWDRVQRRLERSYVMGNSEWGFLPMGGLTTDVVQLVEDAEIEDEIRLSLENTLDQYAREFDREMKEMMRVRKEQEEIAEEATEDGDWMGAMDELNDAFVKVRDRLVVLRNVNERYMRQVIAALPETQASAIEREYLEDAYPAIYRDSVASSQFRTALEEIDSLSENQRERILALQATYDREADVIRERLIAEAREREEGLELRDMWGGRNRGDDSGEDQRIRELSSKFSEQLMAILTPDQQQRVPQEEGGSDWRERDFSF